MIDRDMPDHHGVPSAAQAQTYPNETIRLLIERASCRHFSDEPVSPEVLRWILEAGTHAASGGNLQPFSIIQIQDSAMRRALAEKCGQGFIGEAPIDLVFCIDLHRLERWARLDVAPFTATHSFRHFWVSFQDTIICAQSICTAADALGLGSVYIGTVLEFFAELREMLDLPRGVFPVVLLCLGYPRQQAEPRKKLAVDVIVHRERYHELDDQALCDAFAEKYPGYRVEITESRLERLAEVCRQAHGEAFAQACLAKVRETGYITPVQRYFGLHYHANEMPVGNEAFLAVLREAGLDWFEEWSPVEDED